VEIGGHKLDQSSIYNWLPTSDMQENFLSTSLTT
jgi:hypothetical protein